MKKLLMMVAMLPMVTGVLFATKTNPKSNQKNYQRTDINLVYTKLVVNKGVNVVLVEKHNGAMLIDGTKEDVDNVVYKVRKGTLYISANKAYKKNNSTVYLSVNNLKSICANGASVIKTDGTLESENLELFVNGEVKFSIKNKGKVVVTEADGYSVEEGIKEEDVK